MIPGDAACLETQGLSDEEKRAYWRGRMSVQVMDAAERARLLVNEVDQLLMQKEHDEATFVAKRAIRQAEQAARQDERRKVAKFVETFDLDGLEQDIASDIRALAEEVT